MESNNSIEELIIRYLQNEIQEDELRVLDAWIHESDANKAHFFELKGLFDTRKEVAFLNHYSVERSWERMAGKLDAISGVSVKSKVLGKQFWLSFLRYAAIIVIAMGVGVGMNQWISNRLYAGDMEYNEIVVEKGGRANTLLLSDGSKIILNASTRFKYPTSFNGDERVVHLEGEAYFEVKHDPARPFIVQVRDVETRVLGTAFNVSAYENEESVYTTLLTGKVQVSLMDQKSDIPSMILKPGMQSCWKSGTGEFSVRKVDTKNVVAWRYGEFVFDEDDIEVVTRMLSRWYEVRFVYDGKRKGRHTFSGKMSKDEKLESILKILTLAGGPEFRVEDGIVHIIEKR